MATHPPSKLRVVSIETRLDESPTDRARVMHERWREAHTGNRDAVRETKDERLKELLEREWSAAADLANYFENRTRLLERRVRELLADPTADPYARKKAVTALHGRKAATVRDANLLTDAEARLVEAYRTLPGAKKQMFFRFLELIEKTQANDRVEEPAGRPTLMEATR